jgi:hypothetical protein
MLVRTFKHRVAVIVSLAAALLASAAQAATPSVTQRIEPSTIGLGDTAQLTIAESGDGAAAITPPMVAGLEFLAVAQSQRIESVNGVTRSTSSVTYQVIPHHAGVFEIPVPQQGGTALELTVTANGSANGSGSANATGSIHSSGAVGSSMAAGAAQATADGSAFVRLRLPTHQLYVGERIPVDIQVGTRDGMVSSLNGAPTLNGDAFTLEPLAANPERTAEVLDGRPYTVFTWHSALEAVKPGDLSLTMQTPLTVKIRHAAPQDSFFAGTGLEDLLDDPTLRNFFGTETEKEITVASAPAKFTVLALPTAGRPADFSGAVGHFMVSSDVSDHQTVAGDPITLRLHVSGAGNFDRVNATMLQHAEHWTTYAPKAVFKPADEVGYRGEKTFEQPVIARDSGSESLPALDFSWFDPVTRRYETAQTAPLRVAVMPAQNGPALNGAASLAQNSATTNGLSPATGAATAATPDGLRPDHVVTGEGLASLVPLSQRPAFIAIPSLMMLAFSGAFFWVGRRRDDTDAGAPTALQTYQSLLYEAAKANDPELFFRAGRAALQQACGSTWHIPPAAVTLETVEARLGPQGTAAQVFRLADEASYSNEALQPCDFRRWHGLIERQLTEVMSTEVMS